MRGVCATLPLGHACRQRLGTCNSAHLCTGSSCNTCSGRQPSAIHSARHCTTIRAVVVLWRERCTVYLCYLLYNDAAVAVLLPDSIADNDLSIAMQIQVHTPRRSPLSHALRSVIQHYWKYFHLCISSNVVGSTACPRVSSLLWDLCSHDLSN